MISAIALLIAAPAAERSKLAQLKDGYEICVRVRAGGLSCGEENAGDTADATLGACQTERVKIAKALDLSSTVARPATASVRAKVDLLKNIDEEMRRIAMLVIIEGRARR